MSYDRLASRLYNVPLLITPEKAEIIASVFNAHIEGRSEKLPAFEPDQRIELAAAESSLRRTDAGYYISNSGVAVIQVHGSLVQRAGSMEAASGMAGYNRIGTMLSAALRDPGVRGVVLEIDSPGGEVSGLIDLAGMVSAADKPVYAHANELAASAAYWLASSAEKVFAPSTGMLGSIGVVMLHVDRSKQVERAGLVYTPIFAGARKLEGSSLAPITEDARKNAQGRVDQVYAMFVDQVAAGRGMTPQKVRATEAGMFSVQEAKAIGLADGIATLGDVIQQMTDNLNRSPFGSKSSFGRAAANAHDDIHKETQMSNESKPAAPIQTAATATVDSSAADARAAGIAEGKATAADAAKEARQAERTRISAIVTHAEAEGRAKMAEHIAHKTEMSVDEAVAMLAAAPKEGAAAGPANLLAAAMAKTPNPKVGVDSGEAGDAPRPAPNAANVFAFRRECVAKARAGNR